jgi:hypothetical protein
LCCVEERAEKGSEKSGKRAKREHVRVGKRETEETEEKIYV